MPEDIPEPAAVLTEEEVGMRASDWSDFRRDYGSHDDAVRSREYAAFCAGWDARHTSRYLTPAQQAAIDRVSHLIEASSHVSASITEALYTDAADRADVASLERLEPRRRADVEAVREKMAEEREAPVTGEPEGAEPLPEHDHRPIQHRDGRAPWCPTCGLDADYNAPHSRFTSRREAWEAALREAGQALATEPGPITPEHLAALRAEIGKPGPAPAFCEAAREIDGRACILAPGHDGHHNYSRVPEKATAWAGTEATAGHPMQIVRPRPIRDEPQA